MLWGAFGGPFVVFRGVGRVLWGSCEGFCGVGAQRQGSGGGEGLGKGLGSSLGLGGGVGGSLGSGGEGRGYRFGSVGLGSPGGWGGGARSTEMRVSGSLRPLFGPHTKKGGTRGLAAAPHGCSGLGLLRILPQTVWESSGLCGQRQATTVKEAVNGKSHCWCWAEVFVVEMKDFLRKVQASWACLA